MMERGKNKLTCFVLYLRFGFGGFGLVLLFVVFHYYLWCVLKNQLIICHPWVLLWAGYSLTHSAVKGKQKRFYL